MKKKQVMIMVTVGIVIAAVSVAAAFWIRDSKRAKEAYEEQIANLEAEVDRLSEPVIVDEVPEVEIDLNVINAQIQDIGELATKEYLYTDAGHFSDPTEFWGIEVPFMTKSFIAKWDGCIKAGVKVDQITVEVNKLKKEIVVHIPPAEILSHEIDDKSFETLDEKDGLFNPVVMEDIRSFDSACKDAMERRAIENGLLEKAFEGAKDIIYKIIYTEIVADEGYQIVFKELEE